MAYCPDYYTNLSVILSRVMNDVGVNEESVLKRRRANLVAENIHTLSRNILHEKVTEYIFGSQTEGTTTVGLNSDTDILCSYELYNVIQDWKDWEHGKANLLMLRDESLYPGYCKLQLLYGHVPLPVREGDCPDDGFFCVDGDGNVVVKTFDVGYTGYVRHGPAETMQTEQHEIDIVLALSFQTWPKQYKQWTPTSRKRDWPTPEMIQHMKSTGCFVVKAAHRFDERNETWRISTSLAERCLMFSLNITQIRCYVLLKMIVKTFIQPLLPDTISSYMCKTMLFHFIENTRKEFWKEHNLLQCVHQTLLFMLAAVLDEHCPNYFNETANLFVGKVDARNKKYLLSIVRPLLRSRGRFLLVINVDNINYRLNTYINGMDYVLSPEEYYNIKIKQSEDMLENFLRKFQTFQRKIKIGLNSTGDFDFVTLTRNLPEKTELQKVALRLYQPFLCSLLATMEAVMSIHRNTNVKPSTLKLFDLSLNSDVSSSRLKFASYLYCTGQLERTLSVLQDVEERMTDSVMMVCGCHGVRYLPGFLEQEASQKYPTTDRLALCVMFSMVESQCCPRELKYELYRSTNEERRDREKRDDWMDLVVMDALPFIYFLQYMTFRQLGLYDRQYMTLNKLSDCVRNNEYLTHRETAYNVLGQCMEYEDLLEDAFECYRRSLSIRPNNNAVRWHILQMMFRLMRGRVLAH